MTLGEKIKIARAKKSLSQQELGLLAETHQKNISKYEQGLVIPSAVTLAKIAFALEVSTDYLLREDNLEVINDTSLLKLFKVIDKMPTDTKTPLVNVIEAFVRDFRTKQAYL